MEKNTHPVHGHHHDGLVFMAPDRNFITDTQDIKITEAHGKSALTILYIFS